MSNTCKQYGINFNQLINKDTKNFATVSAFISVFRKKSKELKIEFNKLSVVSHSKGTPEAILAAALLNTEEDIKRGKFVKCINFCGAELNLNLRKRIYDEYLEKTKKLRIGKTTEESLTFVKNMINQNTSNVVL